MISSRVKYTRNVTIVQAKLSQPHDMLQKVSQLQKRPKEGKIRSFPFWEAPKKKNLVIVIIFGISCNYLSIFSNSPHNI
jgi:hypothetical protein